MTTDIKKIKLPLNKVVSLFTRYASNRIISQLKSVLFISLYLALFQMFVIGIPVQDALSITIGIAVVAVGLAAFLEGLFLAIMPLGELCGLKLPSKCGVKGIVIFSLILGFTATVAEPAISFVQSLGSSVTPWDAPALYYLLNAGTNYLVATIALGVGAAVVIGMLRFYYTLPMKPFIFTLIPLAGVLTYLVSQRENINSIIGLAWDSGAVTTGPVTVPLVLALGLGVSRISGHDDRGGEGLGVVALASALPIIAVLLLAMVISQIMPMPVSEEVFFSAEFSEQAKLILGDNGLSNRGEAVPTSNSFLMQILGSLRAILPLTLILVLTIKLILKERIAYSDEITLGIILCFVGLLLFNIGMSDGLESLGSQTGESLTRAYQAVERFDKKVVFSPVTEDMVVRTVGASGEIREALIREHLGDISIIPFNREMFNSADSSYTHIPIEMPLWYKDGPKKGYQIVLLFMFIMGFGSTIAEPSLRALGKKLEDMSGGVYRCNFLIWTVAIGVGVGLLFGFARILFDFSILPVLLFAYIGALILTLFSDEQFTAIAWDSGGVTTGPITVPLVLATGVGIGSQAGVVESFGIVAAGSAFPIVSVLLSGIIIKIYHRKEQRKLGSSAITKKEQI